LHKAPSEIPLQVSTVAALTLTSVRGCESRQPLTEAKLAAAIATTPTTRRLVLDADKAASC
jgi:hypothetical protein